MYKPTHYYTTQDLFKRLKSEGITGYTHINNFRQFWLQPREKTGILVCPRGGKNNKYYLFTAKQIEEIVVALRPGGIGHWSFHDSEMPSV
jgi:hypothetical protein